MPGVTHIVITSIVIAETHNTTLGQMYHSIEEAVRLSGIDYTIIRLPLCVEHYAFQLKTIAHQRRFYGSLSPDAPFACFFVRDAAGAAAAILADPMAHKGMTYKLVSSVLTSAEVEAAFSVALGCPVQYCPVRHVVSSHFDHCRIRSLIDSSGVPI